MESPEFKSFRKSLKKTQLQISQLLGVSVKTIHSYEQGWRKIPHHVERQLLFLISRTKDQSKQKQCWDIRDCSMEQRNKCPAWEFDAGKFCWFINGTICTGVIHKTWKEKIEVCKKCEIFNYLFA